MIIYIDYKQKCYNQHFAKFVINCILG